MRDLLGRGKRGIATREGLLILISTLLSRRI